MKNPSKLVKSKKQEKYWQEAVKAVKKSRGYKSINELRGPKDWGLVVKIYKAKKKKHNPSSQLSGEDEILEFHKSQDIRLIDVFLLGPAMVYWGYKRNLTNIEGAMLAAAGVLTILYNGNNYLKNKGK